MYGALREDQDPLVQPGQLSYSSHHYDGNVYLEVILSFQGWSW